MHKTTRSAEKMLVTLLKTVAEEEDVGLANREPVLRYLREPTIGSYMDLDDAAIWSALLCYKDHSNRDISELARRLRDRELYKCVDVGVHDDPRGNLYLRVQRELRNFDWHEDLIFDGSSIEPYKRYSFEDSSALKKVLIQTDTNEPMDIATKSNIVAALRDRERIHRVYAPDSDKADKVLNIVEEMR